MKLHGLDIEVTRGETCSLAITLTESNGAPFRLLTEETFAEFQLHFVMKNNPYSQSEDDFVLDKVLDINTIKRFDDVDIINLEEYAGEDYNPLQWDDDFEPDPEDINRLFYHPDLKDYRYYDTDHWEPYSVVVTIPFEVADTVALSYKTFYYDISIEAYNTEGVIEYRNVIVNQSRFVVSYKV